MNKVARELVFCPIYRVVVPKGGSNGYTEEEYAEIVARDKIRGWSKEEILDWVFENLESIVDSPEPYDASYDD